MNERNAKVDETRALLEEYLDADEVIDRDEARAERLRAEADELDAEAAQLAIRQAEIASRLAPMFDGEDHVVKMHRRGQTFAVSHEPGQMFLTVRAMRGVASLVRMDARPRMFSDADITEAAMHAAFSAFDEGEEAPKAAGWSGRLATIRNGRPVDRVAPALAVIDQEAG